MQSALSQFSILHSQFKKGSAGSRTRSSRATISRDCQYTTPPRLPKHKQKARCRRSLDSGPMQAMDAISADKAGNRAKRALSESRAWGADATTYRRNRQPRAGRGRSARAPAAASYLRIGNSSKPLKSLSPSSPARCRRKGIVILRRRRVKGGYKFFQENFSRSFATSIAA